MLIVDTSVWIDYFNGVKNLHTNFLDTAIMQKPILMGDLILAEILQGFHHDNDFEKARKSLQRFLQVNMINTALAIQSAKNYRFIRQKGITVRKTIDNLIATFCIENELELLHRDSDFDSYEKYLKLKVVHP